MPPKVYLVANKWRSKEPQTVACSGSNNNIREEAAQGTKTKHKKKTSQTCGSWKIKRKKTNNDGKCTRWENNDFTTKVFLHQQHKQTHTHTILITHKTNTHSHVGYRCLVLGACVCVYLCGNVQHMTLQRKRNVM